MDFEQVNTGWDITSFNTTLVHIKSISITQEQVSEASNWFLCSRKSGISLENSKRKYLELALKQSAK